MINLITRVKIKDRGMDRIMRDMRELNDIDIKVGLQSGDRTADGSMDLAHVGAIQEFGYTDSELTIPSRPFMRTTFDEKERVISAFGAKAAVKVMQGKIPPRLAADLIGFKMTGFIQAKIVSGNWKPNSAYTIWRKKSSKPLIDTGRMRQSIQHVLAVR